MRLQGEHLRLSGCSRLQALRPPSPLPGCRHPGSAQVPCRTVETCGGPQGACKLRRGPHLQPLQHPALPAARGHAHRADVRPLRHQPRARPALLLAPAPVGLIARPSLMVLHALTDSSQPLHPQFLFGLCSTSSLVPIDGDTIKVLEGSSCLRREGGAFASRAQRPSLRVRKRAGGHTLGSP